MASRKKAAVAAAPGAQERPIPVLAEKGRRLDAWLDRHAIWLSIILVAIATARIVATYGALSHTFDEPAHIACGMEWLDKGTYRYEPQHPPLARVLTAILPKLDGSHSEGQKSMWDEGLAILFKSGAEERTLALARLGILPFFWIACWVVFAATQWTSESRAAAVLAVLFATMTPSMLAHAGLATTDMALTSLLLLSVYTGWRWLETPTPRGAVASGCATGLAVLAKFSALAFLPAIAVVGIVAWAAMERPGTARIVELLKARAAQAALATAAGALVIWAGFRFSFGKSVSFSFPVPAPELFDGIAAVAQLNATGHLTYLMGAVNTVGWPSFYVIALGVKLPLPLLLLGLCGVILLCWRGRSLTRSWMAGSIVLGVLIFASFFSQIKIGTRHVLPVVAALAMAGGYAASWAIRRAEGRGLLPAAAGAAALALMFSSIRVHPDYVAYFNMVAGDRPEAYLVDSDLDWGQDTKRLARKLKEVGAREVHFNQFLPGNLEKLYGFPPVRPLDLNGLQPGWNAVGVTAMKYGLFGDTRYAYDPGFEFWPEQTPPLERVGSGILLFYRPPDKP